MSEPMTKPPTATEHGPPPATNGPGSAPSPDRNRNEIEPTPGRSPRDSAPRRSGGWADRLITGLFVLGAFGVGYFIHGLVAPPAAEGDQAPAAVASDSAATVWTCSMHPQIRQPKPGLCPICAMDLIPADAGGGADEADGLRELSISREARELLNIQSEPVDRRYVKATVRMVGKVRHDETRQRDITAWFPGRLDRLYVDYTGIGVQKGDHMASIYSPELYSAQAELIRARRATRDRQSSMAVMSAEKMLESGREKLRLWGLTEEQIRQIEAKEKPSEQMTIYSPISGVVMEKNAQEGMYVETGTRIYTVVDLSQVWVVLDAYESDLLWLRYGQTVEFTTEAYPGEVFSGQVAFIDHMLDPRTRTVRVRVNVPNPHGKIKPGLFVRAEVHSQVATGGRVMDPDLADKWICRMHPEVIRDEAGACDLCEMPLVPTESLGYVSVAASAEEEAAPLVVPASAVLRTGTRAIVYVERPEADRPTYEGREIVLGPRAGDSYLILAGLEEGDRVVTQGNFKLDSALQLAAKPSMMNPEAGLGSGADEHEHDGEHGHDHLAVSPSVTTQLLRVQSAARRVAEAMEAGDREAIRSELQAFEEALANVDTDKLEGQAGPLWKELAMRLRNHAVEGRWAASEGRRREAFERLTADLGRLSDRFGLTGDPGTALAGDPDKIPAEFRDPLARLWESYLEAQNALADDTTEPAQAAARSAVEILENLDTGLLDDEARDAWKMVLAEIQQSVEAMQQTGDIEALRASFEGWSDAMPAVVTSANLVAKAGPVYQLYCSMAFDGRGAGWLQASNEVRNPYFGAEMLMCANEVELLASADQPPEEEPAPDPSAQPGDLAELPEAFRDPLARLWKSYLEAQNALADDTTEPARAAVRSAAEILANLDTGLLDGEARDAWEKVLAEIQTSIQGMQAADDIDAVRLAFEGWSDAMLAIVKAPGFDTSTGPIYWLYCDMAFDFRGAGWLQASDQVRNPYFGEEMLMCAGKVDLIAGAERESEEEHRHD